DHSLVFHAAVFAAGTFPIFLRTEDALAEEAILFRTVGAIVDRLGLFHFAERPATNIMRARQADANRAVIVNAIVIDFAGAHVSPPKEGCQLSAISDQVG